MRCSRSALIAVAAGAALVLGVGCSSDDSSSGSSGSSSSSRATTTSSAASSDDQSSNLRDVRYCEVIPSKSDGTTVTTWVYNTLTFNFCPPPQWSQLTEDTINQEYGSQSAELNGPRHWVLNAITSTGGTTSSGETFTFGGIEMGLRATLTSPVGSPTVGNQFYVPSTVGRDTIWTYDAGEEIYELTDPDGNVYVMQSYAQVKDRTLTIKQLPDLASKLSLPAGWAYKSETLTEDLNMNSNGAAHVVNDDLYNSYQRR